MISWRHTLIPKCILTSVFWSSYQKQCDSFFLMIASMFQSSWHRWEESRVQVLLYFASTRWKFPEKLCLPFCSPVSCSVLLWLCRHWLESGFCVSDWCPTPALRLQQCITPHRPVTGEIQQRHAKDPQTPRLYTSWFLLWLCTNRHCRCLLKCFYVAVRPAAQQWTAPSPWCWAPQTESFSNDTLNCSYQSKFTSSTIESSWNHAKIIKHHKLKSKHLKMAQGSLQHDITHLIIIANISPPLLQRVNE